MGSLIGNSWSSNTPSSVCIQSDRLFSNMAEANARFVQISSAAEQKGSEVNYARATLNSLKAQLAEM